MEERGRTVYETVQSRPVLAVSLTAILSSVPLIACVVYVQAFGINVVFSDQWEMVPLLPKLLNGNLSLQDLWTPHNEHRFFFPRAIMLILAYATEWSNIAEMYVVILLLAISTVALLISFRATFGVRDLLLFVPIAFVLLTLRQHGNLLWGYQITFALTQTAAILTLLSLDRHTRCLGRREEQARGWRAFLLALVFAFVATGSSIQGLLIWLAGAALLIFARFPSSRDEGRSAGPEPSFREKGQSYDGLLPLALWTVAGVSVWVFYFIDHTVGPSTVSSMDPSATTLYMLGLLGEPFAVRPLLPSGVFGVLFVILAGSLLFYLIRSASIARHRFWASLILFSLLVMGSITAGRGNLGIETASASRYVTFSVMAWIGVYAMLVGWWRETRSRLLRKFVVLGAVFGVAMQVLYIENARTAGSDIEETRIRARNTTLNVERATEEDLSKTGFSPDAVENRARILKRLDYNVYSEA